MSPIADLVLLVVAIVAAVFLGWKLLQPWRERKEDALHLDRVLGRGSTDDDTAGTVSRRRSRLGRLLFSAGITAPPLIVVVLMLMIAILVGLLVAAAFPRVAWAAIVVALVAVWLEFAFVKELAWVRSWRFENRLVDAIDLMVASLAAGETTQQAITSAANGARDPVRKEFHEVVSRLEASLPIERALGRMVARYDCDGARLFSQTLAAKWELGGPVAPVLQSVNKTIRNGLLLRRQLLSQVSVAQVAAIFIAIIPYFVIPVYLWKRPETLATLWNSAWGPQLLLGAILLQLVGFVWLRRLLRTEL